MGRRSATETIISVYQAFLRRRTWRQAELAAHVGVQVEALRKVLLELEQHGMPLDYEREDNQVYWSVPTRWFPGGTFITADTSCGLLRELWRLPRTPARRKLLEELLAGMRRSEHQPEVESAIVTPSADEDAAHLQLVEDAVLKRVALNMKYFSAHRGALEWRHVSVHRVFPNPPARFVATCHRSLELRWFRVDGIATANLEPTVPRQEAEAQEVDRFIAESAGGFHEAEPVAEHVFFVREPEARWVRKNLIPPMTVKELPSGGIRVTAMTAGALPIARFVVGLGGAARPESDGLRILVVELAQGALTAAAEGRAKRLIAEDLNSRPVTAIRGSQ